MNPISASPAAGSPGTGREPNAVPGDLASIFAAIFAAVAAATSAPQPTPVALPNVPEGATDPAAASELAAENAQTQREGQPSAWPAGLPLSAAATAAGRARSGRSPLAGALGNVAPARQGPLEVVTDPARAADLPAVDPNAMGSQGQPAPATASALLAAAAGSLARMKLGQGTKPAIAEGKLAPGAEAAPGSPVTALAARDGGAPAPAKLDAARTDANAAQSGRGKARAGAGGAGNSAVPEDPATVAAQAAAPGTSVGPAAHAAGVTHRAPLIETPVQGAAAPAAPAQVPDERPQTVNPSHATVAFDGGDGQEGRLRVSLRGNTLRATIDMPDAAAAQRLQQDSATLTRALRAQGFDEARLVIDSPRAAAASERGGQDTTREQKNTREGQPHTGERNARRDRGASRNER